jgi:hypothetical protein
MARDYFDAVAQTTTSIGTGDMTLSTTTPYLGRRTLQSVPGLAVGTTLAYRIATVDANGIETGTWETGEGVYSAPNVFSRTRPQAGSEALPVNFTSGVKKFSLTVNAADMRALAGIVASATFTYNDDTTVATMVSNGVTWTFGYETVDSEPRLKTITGAGTTWTLTYDGVTGLLSSIA